MSESQNSQYFGMDLLSVLLEQKILNEDQVEQVRRRQRRSQSTIQQAIFDLGFAAQEPVYRALSLTSGLILDTVVKGTRKQYELSVIEVYHSQMKSKEE